MSQHFRKHDTPAFIKRREHREGAVLIQHLQFLVRRTENVDFVFRQRIFFELCYQLPVGKFLTDDDKIGDMLIFFQSKNTVGLIQYAIILSCFYAAYRNDVRFMDISF